MKSRRLLSVIPLVLLSSCVAELNKDGTPVPRLACGDFSNHVYSGTMDRNGTPIDTVTIYFIQLPGFKHNVLVTPPPPTVPSGTPQYEIQCSDAPLVFNVLTPLGVKVATWQVSRPQQSGDAFHLTDSGSIVLGGGAEGEFKQTQ